MIYELNRSGVGFVMGGVCAASNSNNFDAKPAPTVSFTAPDMSGP